MIEKVFTIFLQKEENRMEKKILVVIDMQNDFIDGALGTAEAVEIIDRVAEKIKEYRKADCEVIFTRDTHGEDYLQTNEGKQLPVLHCIQGTLGWDITSKLEVKDSKVIDKPSFGSLELAEYIKQNKGNQIELVGLCTDICVIANALVLKTFFPETDILVDASCCAGVTPKSHANAIEAMKMCHIIV